MKDTTKTILATVELFKHVSPQTLDAVVAVATERKLDLGECLFNEGDPGDFMFVVGQGRLDALKDDGERGRVLLRQLGRLDVGGLTSVTLDKPRSATLRASEPSTVLTIARADFLPILAAHPDLVRSLLANLSTKVRSKTRVLASLMDAETGYRCRVAFFDAKAYDRQSFEPLLGKDVAITWIASHLDAHTANLAVGHQAVCAFVNDDLSRPTLERLASHGVALIAMRCAGYNNVDLAAAAELDLSVVRVPAYSPHAVAEHAIALLMTLNRKTHRAANRVREGNFSLVGLVGFDLYGRTAGVVGLGKIGQCAAQLFRGFGMTVLASDVNPPADFAEQNGVEVVSLEDLCRRSDVISLHAPLLPATYHLIDASRIELMKPGVVLINTSRGGLIDAQALIDGLKTGKIGAAGLDVYEEESEYFFQDRSDRVITDDLLARLMTFNNVLITSHQAFLTEQALANIASTTLGSIAEFIAGRRGTALTHAVNPA